MCKKIDILAALLVMSLIMNMLTYISSSERAEGQLCLNNVTISVDPKPDLIVSSISWAPASSGEGDRVMFSVVVENLGGADAGGFAVAYYVDGVRLGDWSFVGLSAGASSAVAFYWEAVGVGSHVVMVIVDVYDEVVEEDEWDNDFLVSFTVGPRLMPDLTVSSMSWTPANPIEGDHIAFRFTVENLVAVYAGDFIVAYYIDDSIVGSHYVAVSVDTITFYWEAVGVGSHVVKVIVDVYDEVVEDNETNNVLEWTFSVDTDPQSTALVSTNPVILEGSSHLQQTQASYYAYGEESSTELLYDDGGAEGWLGPGSSSPLHSHVWFVLFSSPLESSQLLNVTFCLNETINGQNALHYPCKLHVMDLNRSEIFLLEITPDRGGWFTVDLESYFIVVPQQFLVGIEVYQSLQETEGGYVYVPVLGYDINEPDGKSWWISGGGEILWIPFETYDVMIRTVVGSASNTPTSTDLDGNGRIDILDISIVAMAFGAKSEDPNYNSSADLAEPYGEINIIDIATVAYDYGKNI